MTSKAFLMVLFSMVLSASTMMAQDISMFPKAPEGYKRVTIKMKPLKNEDNYKVEFYIGKLEEVDNCNNFFLSGDLEKKNLEGWGYDYYHFDSKAVAGTKMGCLDNKRVKKLVYYQPQMERYNSKLPIVIYVPKDHEVRYRIWTRGATEMKAQ